jgi:hypothetical protein
MPNCLPMPYRLPPQPSVWLRRTTPHSVSTNFAGGDQLDVRALHSGGTPDEVSDDAVAAYVAKYVTKGATESGADLGYRVEGPADIAAAVVPSHVRRLMTTCWRLGDLPELGSLRLRAWAHTLGYRGHILAKSRAYSTTYAALREERAAHERAEKGDLGAPGADRVTESKWRYVGSGHMPKPLFLLPASPKTSRWTVRLPVRSGWRWAVDGAGPGGRPRPAPGARLQQVLHQDQPSRCTTTCDTSGAGSHVVLITAL